MATFKHISSKNADYGAAEQYLTFEHDEFTMKPTLDKNGQIVPRTGYLISSLNCGEEDFAIACMRSNLKYGKNQKREDVKSHHYVHIVINSLRITEVPLLPYMERPVDTREGCKHRCTDAAMEYFKAEVMEMCHRENLYQIDLLHGSKNRVTEREYWAKRKGQAALDKENVSLAAETPAPRQEYPRSIKYRLQRNKAAIIAPKNDGVQRMVDIAAKRAEGKGKGYY